MSGRIYKRGSVYWIDYSHRGERHRESSGSERKKDAKALLQKRGGEIAQGKLPARDEEKLRLADAREAIVNDYKVNGRKSLGTVERAWDANLQRHLGNCPLLSVTTQRMRRYVAERQDEGAANATIRKETVALRRALNLLHHDGQLSTVPYIPSPKVNNVRKGFLDVGDMEAIVEELPIHARPIVRFAFLTGWRKSETLSLRWSQVDFDAGEIRLEPGTTKNDEGRTFPFRMLAPLSRLLELQRERTRELEIKRGEIIPWVFHRNGNRIRSIRSAWNRASKKAGLEGAWFHDLRRSAVRNLERAGVSRSVATKLTGHKTESVYRRYAIADKTALEEGVGKLATLHDASAPERRSVVPLEQAREA